MCAINCMQLIVIYVTQTIDPSSDEHRVLRVWWPSKWIMHANGLLQFETTYFRKEIRIYAKLIRFVAPDYAIVEHLEKSAFN